MKNLRKTRLHKRTPRHRAAPTARTATIEDLDPTDESHDLFGELLERNGGNMARAEASYYALTT